MALVAYGTSSAEEESSEDDGESSPTKILSSKKSTAPGISEPSGLFSFLPAPKTSAVSTEDDLKDVPIAGPKPKKLIKITVPSLKEFEDVEIEELEKKKFKPSPTGSGLLGMLPKPQNISIKQAARQLTPHVFTRKTPIKPPAKSAIKTKEMPAKSISKKEDNNSDDEEVTDFFSLDSVNTLPAVSIPKPPEEPKPVDIAAPVPGFSYNTSASGASNTDNMQYNTFATQAQNPGVSYEEQPGGSNLPADVFRDERFLRLKGRVKEEINFIDINGSDQMPKPEDWIKTISVEQSRPSHKGQMPNSQSRRKHQITYLAYQAKERELELKNQWAENRLTKKQTQAKYGF